MIEYLKIFDGQFRSSQADDADWIRASSPDEEEIRHISDLTGIDEFDLRLPMKRNRGSAYTSEDGYNILLLDAPYDNKEGNSMYNTSSIAIFHMDGKLVTVSQKKSDILTDFIENPRRISHLTDRWT
ncbi:MAG: CorA family divalent cation transporter [Candidatus Methanomethylophilaceae archaeon]|jgi:Mg2+ and Co2+ transporter CorA